MELEIEKAEQYVVLKPITSELEDSHAAKIEKAIASIFSSEGRVNYILNLTGINKISESNIVLLSKVQRLIEKESGLWVVVTSESDVLDKISSEAEEFILMLPTIEEAIDAVFMNELENEFKDGEDEDEFGFDEQEY